MEHGIGIRCLGLGVDFLVVGIYGDPGSAGSKSGLPGIVPLYRSPCVIAALEDDAGPEVLVGNNTVAAPLLVGVNTLNVTELFGTLERIIGHAQFFALIDIRSTLLHMQTGSQHFSGSLSVLRTVIAEVGNCPGLIVTKNIC